MFPAGCVTPDRTYRYTKYMVAKKYEPGEISLIHQIENEPWIDKPDYVIANTMGFEGEVYDLALIYFRTPRRSSRLRMKLPRTEIKGYERNIHVGIDIIRSGGEIGGVAVEYGEIPLTRGDKTKMTYRKAKEAIAKGDTSGISPALVKQLTRVQSIPRETFSSMSYKRKNIHDYKSGHLPLREHQAYDANRKFKYHKSVLSVRDLVEV